MSYIGDFPEDFATVSILFTTHAASGAPVAPSSGFEAADIKIYKNGSATEKTSTNGLTMTSPFDSITGLHCLVIDTSVDTGDVGFWVAGAQYTVVLSPDETVDSLAVAKVIGSFGIELSEVLRPTTAGRQLDVSAGGEAGIDWANIGSPTTAVNLSGTNIDVDQVVASVSGAVGSVTGAAGSVTGAVGSVTGNVGGNVTGSVGSVATGGITAGSFASGAIDNAAIAADAIGSSELAASAVTEIQSGLSILDAPGIRSAVGLASANLDTQIGTLATPTNITAGTITTVTNLTNAPTSGDLTATMKTSVTTAATAATPVAASVTGNVGGNVVGSVGSVTGLTASNLDATVSSRSTYAGGDTSGTTTLLSRLSATRAGYLDNLSAGAVATAASITALPQAIWDVLTSALTTVGSIGKLLVDNVNATISSRLASSGYTAPLDAAGTRSAVGLASANLDTQIDAIPTNADLATALGTADDAVLAAIAALTIPTASANAAALLAAAFEDAETVQDFLRLSRAALYGVGVNLDTSAPKYKSADGSKNRIVVTGADADGNRPTVTLDPA